MEKTYYIEGFKSELEKIGYGEVIEGTLPKFYERHPMLGRVIGGTAAGAIAAPVGYSYIKFLDKLFTNPSFRKNLLSLAGLGAILGAGVGAAKGIGRIISQKKPESKLVKTLRK